MNAYAQKMYEQIKKDDAKLDKMVDKFLATGDLDLAVADEPEIAVPCDYDHDEDDGGTDGHWDESQK